LVFEFNKKTANKLKKTDMKRAKWINTLTGVFLLLFSYGNMSGISDRPVGIDSDQTPDKSSQEKTKTTQTVSKSVQTKPKTAQTKSKSSQTKTKTSQKATKPEPVKKSEYPGTVRIGTQAWAVANLNVSTFRNGDTIPEAKTNKEWVAAGESGKPAWCYYNNDPKIGQIYGKLYNWFAVNDPRGLAPDGWTLPSDADWARLINYLGGPGPAGGKLKSTSRWNEGSNGTNESGFTAFPGGYRVENGTFQNIGSIGIWWSSAENNPPSAIDHYLSISNSCNTSNSPKQRGESVRCIRN
jgi:uncharacterized protein (TIGR02145 family)